MVNISNFNLFEENIHDEIQKVIETKNNLFKFSFNLLSNEIWEIYDQIGSQGINNFIISYRKVASIFEVTDLRIKFKFFSK